jgi:hypothetical protein
VIRSAGTSTVSSLLWLVRSRFTFRALGWHGCERSLRCHIVLKVAGLTSYPSQRPELISISVSGCRGGPRSTIFDLPSLELNRWKESWMGHYCRICGRQRPNEQFSGKGHRIHVCKRCQAKPKGERRVIENMDEIFRFMRQSHISEKNVVGLEQMVKSENPNVAGLAAIVLRVAQVKPYRTRRLKFLAQRHPETVARIGGHGSGSFSQLGLGDCGTLRPGECAQLHCAISPRIGSWRHSKRLLHL